MRREMYIVLQDILVNSKSFEGYRKSICKKKIAKCSQLMSCFQEYGILYFTYDCIVLLITIKWKNKSNKN